MADSGFFDQPDDVRKLALIVEEREFWVSRETLALHSPVFKAMLYGSFAEANQDKITLAGKKAQDIEELLRCLLPSPRMKEINDENLELLLSLADEYQIEDIRSRADCFLRHQKLPACGHGDDTLLHILRVASKFRLKETLFLSIKRCAAEFAYSKLQPLAKELPAEVAAALFYAFAGPLSGSCRYEFCRGGSDKSCYNYNDHQCHFTHRFIECTVCSKRFCEKCVANDLLYDSCTGDSGAESDVRAFLDRM